MTQVWMIVSATICLLVAGQTGSGLSSEALNVLKADNYFQMARQAKASGDIKKASDYLNKILALKFPPSAQAQRLLGGTYLLLAEIQLGQNKLNKAKSSALSAIKRCGSQPSLILAETYKLLSKIAKAQGKAKESQEYLEKSMAVLEKIR